METEVFNRILDGCMALLLAGVAVLFWPWSFEHHAARNLLVQSVGFIAGGAWAAKYLLGGARPVRTGGGTFLWLLGLFALSGVISLLFVSSFAGPTKEDLMLRLSYVLLAAVAMTEWSSAGKLRRAAMWMALGLGMVTAYGVVQALGVDPMPWKGSHGTRVFSTMGNPNMLAGFAVAVLPFVLLGVRESVGMRRVVFALGLAGAYLLVWLAGSRSGFIGAGAATVVML